jgi:hypothetical protein
MYYFKIMKSKAINKMIIMIKEETIENSVKTLLSDILEYDNVVNDMYEDNVLAEDDIEELDLSKEKDDFER